MKKLTLAISAIAAAFGAASAQADVSVSGSGSAAYIAPAGSGDSKLNVGQFVSFGLSTTTASGMTITGGMGLSNTITTDAGQAVSGGQTLSFATGGATITIGDVTGNDEPGSVGGVVGGHVGDNGGLNSNVGSGFVDDDGLGIAFSTAVGASTLNITYVSNDDTNTLGAINAAASNAMTAAGMTIPMGAYTISAGIADSDTGESSSGASVSTAIGGGTLVVGYGQQTLKTAEKSTAVSFAATATADTSVSTITTTAATNGDLDVDGDTTVMGATYTMSLDADTTISVGIQNKKDADSDSTSQFDASVSRSLGGGASVFLDIRNLSGDASQDGSAVAVGTSVSF
jgi:hypothetical protein